MSRTSDLNSRAPGFTLVELMISLSLLAIVLGGVLAAYLFLGRNLSRMAYAQQQQVQSRRALRTFTEDLSTANQLSSNSTSSYINLAKPTTVTFRYANGTAQNRPMTITVVAADGTVVNSSLAFYGTGGWTTWATTSIVVNLTPGVNLTTIRATALTADGSPNLDKIDVSNDGSSAAVAYQAENATISDAVVATTHSGYTGTGFVDGFNVVGCYVQWAVNLAGTTVQYAYDAASGRLDRIETVPPAAASTQILLSGLTAFSFTYYDSGGTVVTSSPQSVKTVEFAFTSTAGSSMSATQSQFRSVSPRVVLRNKPVLQ